MGDRRQRDRGAVAARRARAGRDADGLRVVGRPRLRARRTGREEHREAYRAEPPVCDPATGEVDPDYGRIPERVRTWPGALRSVHPEASVVAVGPRAAWLTEPARGRLRGGQPVRAAGGGGRPGADARRAAGDRHAAAPRRGDRLGARQADGHLRDRAGRRHDAVVHGHRDLAAARMPTSRSGWRPTSSRSSPVTRWPRASACAGAWARRSATCSRLRELTAFAVAWIEERFG